MIETPHITHVPAEAIAVIHIAVPRAEIGRVMAPTLAELRAVVARQGVAADGPWFAHHVRMDAHAFEFEVGVPVTRAVQAEGRVTPAERPSMKVARTVYHGGYEGLHAAWGEFDRWVANSGERPLRDLWELYVTTPESSPDPATYRTELHRPLAE